MIIWKDIAVVIVRKMAHVRKIGGKVRVGFIKTYGDVPVARFNEVTGKMEEVVNPRGRAYAARHRQTYRSKA